MRAFFFYEGWVALGSTGHGGLQWPLCVHTTAYREHMCGHSLCFFVPLAFFHLCVFLHTHTARFSGILRVVAVFSLCGLSPPALAPTDHIDWRGSLYGAAFVLMS